MWFGVSDYEKLFQFLVNKCIVVAQLTVLWLDGVSFA